MLDIILKTSEYDGLFGVYFTKSDASFVIEKSEEKSALWFLRKQ